jgi:hypothetical protein
MAKEAAWDPWSMAKEVARGARTRDLRRVSACIAVRRSQGDCVHEGLSRLGLVLISLQPCPPYPGHAVSKQYNNLSTDYVRSVAFTCKWGAEHSCV